MWWAAIFVLVGCGRIGFDPTGDGGTGGERTGDGSTMIDANFPICVSRPATAVPPSGFLSGIITANGTLASGSCAGAQTSEDLFSLDVTLPESRIQLASDVLQDSDVSLYVRTDCADTGTELACSIDDGANSWPLITQSVPVGRYFVFVDGVDPSMLGNYEATMKVLLPEGSPCNDAVPRERCDGSLVCVSGLCEKAACTPDAVFTGAGPFRQTFDTSTATNTHGGSCGGGNDGGLRIGERVVRLDLANAVSNAVVSTDNPGTDFDTLIYMRSNCDGPEIECDDDGGNQNSSVIMTGPLSAGSYFIFLDGFSDSNGNADLSITLVP